MCIRDRIRCKSSFEGTNFEIEKKHVVDVSYAMIHSGPDNLKKSRPKKLMKSNKSVSRIFWPNSIFDNFKNHQKSIFELGKILKLPKMQFHEKKNLIYLIS